MTWFFFGSRSLPQLLGMQGLVVVIVYWIIHTNFRREAQTSITLKLLQAGGIEDAEMRRTFNMGIGMVLVVTSEASRRILAEARADDPAYLVGEVVRGDGVQFAWDAHPLKSWMRRGEQKGTILYSNNHSFWIIFEIFSCKTTCMFVCLTHLLHFIHLQK